MTNEEEDLLRRKYDLCRLSSLPQSYWVRFNKWIDPIHQETVDWKAELLVLGHARKQDLILLPTPWATEHSSTSTMLWDLGGLMEREAEWNDGGRNGYVGLVWTKFGYCMPLTENLTIPELRSLQDLGVYHGLSRI